jgi:hypothetical protein
VVRRAQNLLCLLIAQVEFSCEFSGSSLGSVSCSALTAWKPRNPDPCGLSRHLPVKAVCQTHETKRIGHCVRRARKATRALCRWPLSVRTRIFFDQFCSSEHVLGGDKVSRVRLSGCGLIDLFTEDVAVTCVPGEFFDHGEQGPSHADCSFAGIVLGVVEVETGGDHT